MGRHEVSRINLYLQEILARIASRWILSFLSMVLCIDIATSVTYLGSQ